MPANKMPHTCPAKSEPKKKAVVLSFLIMSFILGPLLSIYWVSSEVAVAGQPKTVSTSIESPDNSALAQVPSSIPTDQRQTTGLHSPSDPSKGSASFASSSGKRQGSQTNCVFLPLLTGGGGSAATTQSNPAETRGAGSIIDCFATEPATIVRTSPSNGEDGVAVTRETIIEFTSPIDPTSVTTATISAQFGGNSLATRLHISPDNRKVTLFYNEPLPASVRVRVTIDGEQLQDAEGNAVDVDGDGEAGGITYIDFDTLTLTVIEGTSVCGRVFASELDTTHSATAVNVPLAGATITVDGMEESLNTTTDNKGNFCLDPAPAGRFFVHIDGRTATNGVPEGSYYPFVGKTWESVISQQTNVGNVYLPLVPEGTLQAVSESSDTTIHLADSVLEQFPDFADVSITVPADSLYADNGTRGGQVGIAPVPPDRLPGQLPEELNFPVVITVQTDGATNFDQPAPVCFPNLPDPDTGEPLPAGAKSALFSFNHDTGKWEIAGSMTVSQDGELICADEGVGVRAPGWHGSQPGSGGSGGGNGPPDCPDCNPKKVEENASNCLRDTLIGAIPGIGCAYSFGSALGGCTSKSIGRCFWDLGVSGIGCLPGYGTVISAGLSTYTCLYDFANDVWNTYKNCRGSSCSRQISSSHYVININPIIEDDIFAEQLALWDAGDVLFDAVVGNSKWRHINNEADSQLAQDFYLALNDSLAESSPEGLIITTSEQQSLLKLPLPSTITSADAEALIDRMNLIANEQLPQAEIAAIRAASGDLEETALELEARGWTTTIDAFTRGPEVVGNAIVAGVSKVSHFYKITNLNTGTILRGQLGSGGTFSNQILAPNTLYEVSYVEPSTLQTASTVFLSGENGSNTEIPKAVLTESDTPDSDADGLSDEAEDIIGTNANNPDTDDDGIPDGAEVQQGTNPLDGLAVATGIIASVDTPGTALDVCALNDIAAVADSDTGVSVFNVFNGMNPSIIAQVDTPANARTVACAPDLVAVADSDAGLTVIDISDPPAAQIIHEVELDSEVQALIIVDNIAYVGTTLGQIAMVELSSGAQLGQVSIANRAVQDIGMGKDYLYVLTEGQLHTLSLLNGLQVVDVDESLGSLGAGGRRLRLFIGDEIAYAVHTRGYNTFSLATPANPELIATGSTSQFGWKQIVSNGSGIGVAAVSPNSTNDGPHHISLYDLSDPTQTDVFVTQFETPGLAEGVAIYNGLAYVADSQAGMQVINYLAYDSQGVPPTIALTTNVTGNEVAEGSLVRGTADVSDDVQVRNVEFYLDGNRVATDGTFPFEYRFFAPPLSEQSSFTLMARATDTGGNSTESDLLTVNIIPDTEPPSVSIVAPVNGELFTLLDNAIRIKVNATDNVRVADLSFKVDGTPVSAKRISLDTYEIAMPTTIGTYQLSAVATDGADLSSESAPVSVEVIEFEIEDQVSAMIDYAGDLDRYLFSAQAGQVVFFDWQAESNSSWRWKVTDSAGTVIFDRTLFDDPGTYPLELGGIYTMIIGNQDSEDTGAYQFQLLDVPQADVFNIAIGDIVSDGVPAPGAGNIEEPGSIDTYTFQATAGQLVYFDLQEGFNDEWRWELVDSEGTVIFNQNFRDDPESEVLELGGTYTMTIGNPNSDHAGTYQLQLLDLSQRDEEQSRGTSLR